MRFLKVRKIILFILSMVLIVSIIKTTNADFNPIRYDMQGEYSSRIIPETQVLVSLNSIQHNIPTSSNNAKISICGDFLDWGVDDIDAEKVWGNVDHATNVVTEHNGDGITIAILDTGIDKAGSNYNVEFDGKIIAEYDFVNNDGDATDDNGHGTHCAGIIAAKDNDVGIIGVAPYSSLLIAKVLNSAGVCYDIDYLVDAIFWSITQGADIISMSLETYGDYPELHDAITYAYQNGVVLVAASGNGNYDYISYPAMYPEVISVGSISEDHTRSVWSIFSGSNYGNNLDLVAPGNNIYSTYLYDQYIKLNGTSMAAPHVAGLCALILQVQPLLTNQQVKEILRITTTDLGPNGRDNEYGYGEVHAVKAVDAAELYFTDTDGDDLTDSEEKYVYYTNRFDSDTDNDGLNDGQEVHVYYTDPHDIDTDNDSMSDGWEVNNGLNPLSASDKYADPDGEGLRNFREYYLGTNPNDPDTDNDYLTDKEEFDWALNPLDDDENHNGIRDDNDDFDYDGLTNKEEIRGWFDENDDGIYQSNEKDWYITNPKDSDTDDDGWDDYFEQHPPPDFNTSNPRDSLSTPTGSGGGFFFP